MAKDKKVEQITDMEKDFAQWFTDVCTKAELVDYSGVKGCYIMRPYGYAIWENIQQILDGMFKRDGHTNVQLVIPSSGTSFEIGATAIFKGAKHPNAAKLWIEYALSPDCVNIAKDNGSYQFLVIDNAEQPSQAAEFGLDPDNVMEYDFEDATANIKTYVEEVMTALAEAGADTGDGRFKTE